MDGWMMDGQTEDTDTCLALLAIASSPPLLSVAHWVQERSQRGDPIHSPHRESQMESL